MIYAFKYNGKLIQKETRMPPRVDWWIRFDPKKHSYTTSDGYKYISTTQWLSSIDDRPFNSERTAVECAAQREGNYAGMTPREILAQWQDTAVVGSGLHAAIESSLKGNPVADCYMPQVSQFREWQAEHPGVTWKSEVILWSNHYHIAGMFDVITWSQDVGTTIYDVKTFKHLSYERKDKAAKQMTLGAMMFEEITGKICNVGGILVFENYYQLREKAKLQFVKCKDEREKIQPQLLAREYKARQEEEYHMALKMTGGVLARPKRIVLHGTEGVGKTELASYFPDPVWIDAEDSSAQIDVMRLPAPYSWNALEMLLADVLKEGVGDRKTIVVDTIDWVERACCDSVAQAANKNNFGDIPHGRGYVALSHKMKGLLDTLSEIQKKHDVHVVLVAHTWIRRVDPPDKPDGYDRYELKLQKQVAPLVREWCDMLLFLNFVSEVKEVDSGKAKGVGDGTKRVVHTSHTDAYDAKNRCGLPPTLPFEKEKRKALAEYLISGGKKTKEAK